jgi:hypothetical protein
MNLIDVSRYLLWKGCLPVVYLMGSIMPILCVVTLLAGCATSKQWSAVSGSRSDGVVRLAFDYGMFEKPVLETDQGVQVATRRCQAWGYTGAEPFGGTMQQCIARNQHGCTAWRVFADFQCAGR